MEFVTLNNGLKMPMEGFGVYQVTNLSECEEAVYNAILAGYRLIDTASVYRNEEAVGNAIRRAIEEKIVTREELFITTKLWVQDYENAQEAIESSLKKTWNRLFGFISVSPFHGRLYWCLSSYGTEL